MRKAACMKHQAARARSRLEEVAFDTFNVRIAATKDVNGIGHIDSLLRPCAANGCESSDCRRPCETKLLKLSQPDAASTSAAIAAGSKGRQGNMGLDRR